MKRLPWAIIFLLIVGAFVYRFQRTGEEVATPSIAEVQARDGVPVEVVDVRLGTVALWREFSGTVAGMRQTALAALFSDEVREILHAEGDLVEEGALVLRLAHTKSMPGFGLRYPQARAARDDARREVERMASLQAVGAVSQQVLDKARLALEIAAADLRAAEDVIDLKAPFPGLLTQMNIKVGEVAQPGAALAVISDLSRALVTLHVGQEDLRRIRVGQVARTRAADGRWLAGEVHRLPLSANATTRLFEVELVFDNPERLLLPGMVAAAEVLLAEEKDVPVVPREAIGQDGRGAYVWLVDGGRAERRAIEVGLVNHEQAAIASGLHLADQVVVSGQSRLQPGVLVKIVQLGS